MERLWAPWRMGYIVQEKSDGCLFCQKSCHDDDRASYIVWRGETSFVMLNTFPYNNGHLMVAPYAHVAELEELPPATLIEMLGLCQDAIRALRRDFKPEGLNIGFNLGAAAGAGVTDHLHLHVVPRWFGDTNFMPVTADARVIPQSLDEAYRLIHQAFLELKPVQRDSGAGDRRRTG